MDIANALKLARRAREDNDSEGAKKYYELVLLEDPDNWEANFYGAYFTAQSTSLQNIPSTANGFANKLRSSLRLVKENIEDPKELELTVISMSNAVVDTAVFYRNNALNFRSKHNDISSTSVWIKSAINLVITFADNVEELFPDDDALIKIAVEDWKAAFDSISGDRWTYYSDRQAHLNPLKEKIRKYEPEFHVKEDEEAEKKRQEEAEKKKNEPAKKAAVSCGSALLTMLFGR